MIKELKIGIDGIYWTVIKIINAKPRVALHSTVED